MNASKNSPLICFRKLLAALLAVLGDFLGVLSGMNGVLGYFPGVLKWGEGAHPIVGRFKMLSQAFQVFSELPKCPKIKTNQEAPKPYAALPSTQAL